jgi:hypothetical protein
MLATTVNAIIKGTGLDEAAVRPKWQEAAQMSEVLPELGWNVAVIVAGVLIAAVGFSAQLLANPGASAPRQTVAALWLIQGLFGLLIATVGILGATIVSALRHLAAVDICLRRLPPSAVP